MLLPMEWRHCPSFASSTSRSCIEYYQVYNHEVMTVTVSQAESRKCKILKKKTELTTRLLILLWLENTHDKNPFSLKPWLIMNDFGKPYPIQTALLVLFSVEAASNTTLNSIKKWCVSIFSQCLFSPDLGHLSYSACVLIEHSIVR